MYSTNDLYSRNFVSFPTNLIVLDVTYYPFDAQYCELKFASWTTEVNRVSWKKAQNQRKLCGCTLHTTNKIRFMYPGNETARPHSQFPHLCICERFIFSHDRSTYFAPAKLADRSWEYINRSQIHDCRK